MNVLPHPQHSPQWHTARASAFTASEAPAALGASLYTTRSDLLREKHSGVRAEIDTATHMRFENGHRVEALARPLAEEIIGEELYNVTGYINVRGVGRPLLASFDGLTLDERTAFEHKALGAELRKAFAAGAAEDSSLLPLHYRAQMQQQCMVAGCERVLFMASEWDADGQLVEEHHCWFVPDAELAAQIVAAWIQFERDLAAYVLPAPAPEPARAEHIESLPAVSVRLDGALSVVGNLPTFAVALREFVAKIPTRPSTDTEFATTEAACKALKKAEEALDAAEAGALASITDVDAMRRAVADCRKLARDTRLAAEKMVERRKLEIKEQAVMTARRALDAHIAALNGELAPMRLQPASVDFAGAIKGLRSFDSMQSALDTALAAAKIAADAAARGIRTNVAAFQQQAAGLEFLFADLGQLVHKAPDDFAAVLQARIATHRAAEERRAREKAEAEARAAEQRRQAEEAARVAAEAAAARAAAVAVPPAPPVVPVQAASVPPAAQIVSPPAPIVPAPRVDEPATLKLGVICERLGFTVSAAFLADVLHVAAAKADGRAVLFRESQFPVICRQLQAHVGAMVELYAGEPA